jgi:excisionase family DNA binding protein
MPFAQRLTCTIDDACEVTGLGRTKLYELIGTGRIVTTTIGRRRLALLWQKVDFAAIYRIPESIFQ